MERPVLRRPSQSDLLIIINGEKVFLCPRMLKKGDGAAGMLPVLPHRARSQGAGVPIALQMQRVDDGRSRDHPNHPGEWIDLRSRWLAFLSILHAGSYDRWGKERA